MKRLVAALVIAAVPAASASALPPPQHRAVGCTKQHVLEDTSPQRFVHCLNQRDGGSGDVMECFEQYVIRAEPVPQTPAEHVAAAERDVRRTVTFATCVAS